MEHPILNRIRRESFTPLGWFSPTDMGETKFVILIGNAGPAMFARFARGGVTLWMSGRGRVLSRWLST